MNGLKIAIAFQRQKTLKKVAEIVSECGGIIVGKASDSAAAKRLISTLEPDVILLEGSRTFLETAKYLAEEKPLPVLMVMGENSWDEIGLEVEKWMLDATVMPLNRKKLEIALSVCIEKFAKTRDEIHHSETLHSKSTTRNMVESAKLKLMTELRLSEIQSLNKMQITSHTRGITLRDLAKEILNSNMSELPI